MSQPYRLYCIDEAKVVRVWASTQPTVCPHNSVHTIALDSVTVDDQYNNLIKASENSEGDFETMHIKMDIPSGTPGDITEHDVSWVMDIMLWTTYLTPTSDMIGDEITVMADPERTVGTITSLVNIGDTVLNVSSTVFDYVQRGYFVTLNDGVNKDTLGRITAVDAGAGTVTVQNPTSYAFAIGTPFQRSIYVLQDIYIADTNTIPIGRKGMKGKLVDAGIILRVYYTNNSGTAKSFRWRAECYNRG